MKNYKAIGIIIILVTIGFFLVYSYVDGGNSELNKNNKENIFVDEDVDSEQESGQESKELHTNDKKIVVEIKGEINAPNVYWINENSIIEDLINLAGGITSNANLNGINRAEKLIDHECIIIPNKNDQILQTGSQSNLSSEGNGSTNNLVNINTATQEELQNLPGIGPSKASAIIQYREENGEFKVIEDLKNVSGIGDASFQKLKDKIRI